MVHNISSFGVINTLVYDGWGGGGGGEGVKFQYMPKYGHWGQKNCQTHILHFWPSELQKAIKISL